MNYFAHAVHFLDRPHFMVGTGVPDWLAVADRRVRVRSRHVLAFRGDAEPSTAAVAGGILQHLRDDAWFHASRAFAVASLEMTVKVCAALGEETGLRPHFLGHLLVEVLLDAALMADDLSRLAAYYRVLAAVDARAVEQVVNRMAPRSTDRLAVLISRFCQQQILSDYLEDAKLMGRLNQVMGRVGFPPLPGHFREILPAARRLVELRRGDLLEGILTQTLDPRF